MTWAKKIVNAGFGPFLDALGPAKNGLPPERGAKIYINRIPVFDIFMGQALARPAGRPKMDQNGTKSRYEEKSASWLDMGPNMAPSWPSSR